MINIIIGSTGKCGSYLLMRLLDGHPDIVVFHEEFNFLSFFNKGVLLSDNRRDDVGYPPRLRANKKFLFQKYWEKRGDALVNKYHRVIRPEVWEEYIDSIPENEMIYIEEFLDIFRDVYLKSINRSPDGIKFFVYKIVEASYIPLYSYIPGVKLVVLTRNPLALFNTAVKNCIKKGHPIVGNSIERFGPIMEKIISHIFNEFSCLIEPDRFHLIRYEDMCSEPRKTLENLMNWLGTEWNDCLLERTLFGKPDYGYTEASGQQKEDTTNKIRTDSLFKFEESLGSREKYLVCLLLEKYLPLSSYIDYFKDKPYYRRAAGKSLPGKYLSAFLNLILPIEGEFIRSFGVLRCFVFYILRRLYYFLKIYQIERDPRHSNCRTYLEKISQND